MVAILPIITALAPLATQLFNLIPDKNKALQLQADFLKAQQANDQELALKTIELAIQQAKINEEYARSDSFFKAGARPAAMWVCVTALGYHYLFMPMAIGILSIWSITVNFPALNMYDLMTLLFGMLGLGAYRSYDKKEELNHESLFKKIREISGKPLSQEQVDTQNSLLKK